jgi:hypothetical protein
MRDAREGLDVLFYATKLASRAERYIKQGATPAEAVERVNADEAAAHPRLGDDSVADKARELWAWFFGEFFGPSAGWAGPGAL